MRCWSLTLMFAAIAAAQLGPAGSQKLPPSDLDRIQIGQPAPDFTLRASDGRTLSLSSFLGKNVVLVFYRGHW